MPSVRENEDSEGEEMDQDESDDIDKTDSSDSESTFGSDEENSELDEAECEKRRNECMQDMADLEKQFTELKERLYAEKMRQIEAKLEEVRAGKANEYLHPLSQLQENMKIRTQVAGILRELQLENLKNVGEAEELASSQNRESEKRLLYDMLKEELDDKIRKLEEDRHNIDLTSDLWTQPVIVTKKNKRKTDPLYPDRRKKPVSVSGPYLVYMLNEADIVEDWTLIKKAITMQKRKPLL